MNIHIGMVSRGRQFPDCSLWCFDDDRTETRILTPTNGAGSFGGPEG